MRCRSKSTFSVRVLIWRVTAYTSTNMEKALATLSPELKEGNFLSMRLLEDNPVGTGKQP